MVGELAGTMPGPPGSRAEAERDALRRELADPANREALEQSRRADDIATDPGGGVTEDPRGGDRK